VEEETGPDPWEESVAAFVEAHLLMPPSRVLDVGCGNGWLTRRLGEAGYEAKGTDPDAPEGPLFDRLALEEFVDPRRFDAIVCRSVPASHPRSRSRRPQDRRSAESPGNPNNWLHRRCAELRNSLQEGKVLETAEHFRRWAAEEGFHSSRAILEELGKRFKEQSFAWNPYLFPDLEGVTEVDELGAIESGVIQPIGFRFVGQRRR
jgi:SAM-dependent methyltransferase